MDPTPARDVLPSVPRRRPIASGDGPGPLGPLEQATAVTVFVLWIVAFTGGILINTEPYRARISLEGAAVFGAVPADTLVLRYPELDRARARQLDAARAAAHPTRPRPSLPVAWAVVLVWFLPVNLALLCALAGALGAFGSHANLQADPTPDTPRRGPPDASNPYVSALLRGFFVYLIMISGLLLLDDAPFAAPSPGQYIRLAGLLSLFSFVVNYNPQLFSKLLLMAAGRIRAAEEPPSTATQTATQVATQVTQTATQVTQTATQVTGSAPEESSDGAGGLAPPPVPAPEGTTPERARG